MKKGQIWIETVIYTLIGLSLIAIVLAIVTPKINEYRDRAVIEQTIDSLNIFDSKVSEVLSAPGNVRKIDFKMKRGKLSFDPLGDDIYFEMDDSRSIYSEPGVEIEVGKIKVLTTEGAKKHKVRLLLNYTHDLTIEGEEVDVKSYASVSTPYSFLIKNNGLQNGVNNIDISVD
jgi:type II secretory pathway pseudopilin PulG